MDDRIRRQFLFEAGLTTCALLVPSIPTLAQTTKETDHRPKQTKEEKEEDEVTPNEDLMREHGVLRRILFVYDESIRRLNASHDFDPALVSSTADIVRQFVEDYHEQLEQQYIFPRLEKGSMKALVDTLLQQHQIGRQLTDRIKQHAGGALKNKDDAKALAEAIEKFKWMYQPHAAWEDTILFPAFKKAVGQHTYDALGEDFERIEHQKFGEDGFEMMLEKVHQTEIKLGIGDPSHYTPQL